MVRAKRIAIFITVLIMCQGISTRSLLSSPDSTEDTLAEGPIFQFQHLDQIGGWSHALDVQGNYAYVGMGNRLVVVDVSQQSTPQVVGKTPLPPFGGIVDMKASDGYVYLTTATTLIVVNVHNPALPTVVGRYPGLSGVLQVLGGYVYVGHHHEFHILKIIDPHCLVEVGNHSFPEGTGISHIAIVNTWAYVAIGGLFVLDLADPTAPHEAGSYPLRGDTWGIEGLAVSGDYLYLSYYGGVWKDYSFDYLLILDISDPTFPTMISEHPPHWAWASLAVAGQYLYNFYGGVEVYDISNPSALQRLGREGVSYLVEGVLEGDCAYITSSEYGLRVIDVSNPVAPTETGFYNPVEIPPRLAMEGSYIYAADDFDESFYIFDISDPTHLTQTGAIYEAGLGDAAYTGSNNRMAVADGYAYIAPNFCVIDISDPVAPTKVGCFRSVRSIVVVNGYAYVIGYSQLYIFDVSDPTLPIEVGRYTLSGAEGLAVHSNYAYVTAATSLYAIDVSNPVSPTGVGHYDAGENLRAVSIQDEYAYVTSREYAEPAVDRLHVIDISDPTNLAEVGRSDVFTPTENIAVFGNNVYVTQFRPEEIGIFDIANPVSPTLIGKYDIYPSARQPGDATSLLISPDYIYMGIWGAGLSAFQYEFEGPLSTTITPSGGQLVSQDGNVTISFPAGTITDTATLSYIPQSPTSTGDLVGLDRFFEITAVYSNTGEVVQLAPGETYTIAVQYDSAQIGPAIENTLALYAWDANQWNRESTSMVDTNAQNIVATPSYFSSWAVLGETQRVYLPIFPNCCFSTIVGWPAGPARSGQEGERQWEEK